MYDYEKALLCRDSDPKTFKMNVPPLFVGEAHNFQQQGAGYLYFIRKALLADATGVGKTIEMILLNCLQKYNRVLQGHVQIVPAQSILQWYKEYRTFAPGLEVRTIFDMDKSDRISQYNRPFDVLLVSYHIVQRDWNYLVQLPYNSIAYDEASFFKNPDTKTFDFVTFLSKKADWIIPMSATPIQNCLVDLWSVFQVFNMERLLGTQAYFTNRYLIRNKQEIFVNHRKKTVSRIVGYQHVEELKSRIGPFYIRRNIADIEQFLPDVVDVDGHVIDREHDGAVWLDLYQEQREVYESCKRDIVTQHYRGTDLRNRFHLLKKTIDGLRTLDDHNPDISVKSDWITDLLTSDLAEEKVVIFSMYKSTIYALQERFRALNIGHAVLSGDEKDKAVRFAIQERFFKDPNLRVILGTTALEMSLNLQAARYLICIDLLYNPSRVIQIVGRIRRLGSQHRTVVMINLLCRGTVEEGLIKILRQRQAVSDFVFDEQSDIFGGLTDNELWSIIRS